MQANRKKVEAFIIKHIDDLLPNSENANAYRERFAQMSDKDFEQFIDRLGNKTEMLVLIAPNLDDGGNLSLERNFAKAEELGHDFFPRIWIDQGNDTPKYLSPIRYLVVDLPLRRQAQLQTKKVSIPEDNKSIDDLTGQPAGKSQGSKISYPEMQLLAAMDLPHATTEFLKYRGGDIKGFNAMNDAIITTGGVSMNTLDKLGTTVRSTQTLHTLLTGMHLSNTLGDK